MAKLHKRENYLNLLEGFHAYYRFQKMVKSEYYKLGLVEIGARELFKELQKMMGETTHGIILKDFGTIVPKDSILEFNDGRFKKSIVIKNKYIFMFHKEWLSEYYRCVLSKTYMNKSKLNIIRVPKPYTINLHRKKILKD